MRRIPRNRQLGANAVETACDLVCELYRFGEQLAREGDPSGRFDPPASTVAVGVINGGTARNILAKQCAFDWEFRGLPHVPQNLAKAHLEAYIARVAPPNLTRYAKDAYIETMSEVEVPGLLPEPGSPAESLALKLARSQSHDQRAFRDRGRSVPGGRRADRRLRPGLDRSGPPAG